MLTERLPREIFAGTEVGLGTLLSETPARQAA